ncbi:MAG: histidine phosphatase family protein [Polyangiaceae bacterium]
MHLLRHGEVHNPERVVYGALPGFFLSARGQAQAEAAGVELARRLRGSVAVVASPLDRARQTQAIVVDALMARAITPRVLAPDPRLGEARTFAEGLPRKFSPRRYWARLREAGVISRGESPREIARRMFEAILSAVDAGGYDELVVVSHQFPIHMAKSAFVAAFDSGPRATLADLAPWALVRGSCELASITTVTVTKGAPIGISYWAPSERR